LKAMSQLLRHSCRRAVTAWQRQPTQQNDVALHASALRPLTTDSRGRDVTNPNLPPSMVKSIIDNERITAEFNSKLRLSSLKAPFSSSIPVFSLRDQSVLSILDLPQENASQPAPLPFTLAPSISGGVQPSIAPPPLPIQQQKEIRDPVKEVTVVISDGHPERAKIGDQPAENAAREIIGDKMENLVKKEAIRILQIRRTKMNRHKLRKWRRKYRHLIKLKIEEKEMKEKKEMDDTLSGIRGDAEAFNPVDKVRHHITLAKDMGYKVTYYENLPLTKWLKEKEAVDAGNSARFKDKNTERYRKYPPWEYEKF